jgi:hypothetical protein
VRSLANAPIGPAPAPDMIARAIKAIDFVEKFDTPDTAAKKLL